MREGNEEQMQRLFGMRPQPTLPQGGSAMEWPEVSARPKGTPSNYISLEAKTMVTDLGLRRMLSRNPIGLNDTFIEGKTVIDVLVEKQQRALSDKDVQVESHFPHGHMLGMLGHAAQNSFEVKVRPFKREAEIVRLTKPQEERDALEAIERLYRKMPGVETSWAKESVNVGDALQERNVLLIKLDKSPDAQRAKAVLLEAAEEKSRRLS